MNLEIGDLVDFDAILGKVKPYGINYVADDGSYSEAVNGQTIYPTFLITSTNKTLEWVEIECINLPDLTEPEREAHTFEADVYHTVLASFPLIGVHRDNLFEDFPELSNLISIIGDAESAYTDQGNWIGGFEYFQAGLSYQIKFSQTTTTNLFQLVESSAMGELDISKAKIGNTIA